MRKIAVWVLLLSICTTLCACGTAVNETNQDNKGATLTTEGSVQTETTIAVAFFGECSDLPTPDSCVGANKTGSSVSSTNGKTTKISYSFSATQEQFQEYQDCLEQNKLEVEKSSDNEFSVVKNTLIIANVSFDGNTLTVNIIPEDRREMSESKAENIRIGETITTKDYTFTLNNVELTYELKPVNTCDWYTSYPAESGKIYIHVDGTYYNTSKRDVCIRDLFVPKANYNDGYRYEGFAVIDDGDTGFDYVGSYIACTPLESCHYHGLIECPEAIESSNAPLYVTFTLADGVTYKYNIR